MPIIEIWLLPPDGDPYDVPAALSAITRRVADFLGEEPSGTWAILHPIEPGHFSEGADAPAVQPRETHPALVRVFARHDPARIDAGGVPGLLAVTGEAVVEAFGLEEGNVVVRFEPAEPDRMHWG